MTQINRRRKLEYENSLFIIDATDFDEEFKDSLIKLTNNAKFSLRKLVSNHAAIETSIICHDFIDD